MKNYLEDQYWGDMDAFMKELERNNRRLSSTYFPKKSVEERIYNDVNPQLDDRIAAQSNVDNIDSTVDYFEYKLNEPELETLFGASDADNALIKEFRENQSRQLTRFMQKHHEFIVEDYDEAIGGIHALISDRIDRLNEALPGDSLDQRLTIIDLLHDVATLSNMAIIIEKRLWNVQ